ncbi:serine protease [Streptomyces sp. NPDC045431]|uniref:serine protease n=1 Tax=Streptomyces sp. NPDC045431 TaxID=3155613 RepID=UPI0033F2AF11
MERGDGATLVHICDAGGRPRGTGFVADDLGTVVTSHEAVDGLRRVVLLGPGGRTCVAEADAITPLPGAALALVRGAGLGARPLPLADRPAVEPGTYVRIAAGGWRQARVLGPADVTYTATDRFHRLGGVLELAVGTEGSEALRRGGEAAGGPVLDAATGAVLGVLATALHAERRAAGFAVPLAAMAARDPAGPLAALLRRSAATVPAYGRDLNPAGVLELAAASGDPDSGGSAWPEPVERAEAARAYELFAASPDALLLGLVGEPGSGRTTELAALAARRARGAEPAPSVWVRAADLRPDDTSVADGLARALRRAARAVAASGRPGLWDDSAAATPERVAALARTAGHPLLVLLDTPDEPTPAWTAGTAAWLRAHGARLAVACRPEQWEHARAPYPGGEARCVRLGDLTEREARWARARYGLPADAVADGDARHPLALRLLAEVREAMGGGAVAGARRDEIFAAYLDLVCLRVAVRVADASRPPVRGTGVRRLAARVAGRVHAVARRCPDPEVDRAVFEELFPWKGGWASAVLAEGLLVPVGSGYRFGHEELGEWLRAAHLDLDAALRAPDGEARTAGLAARALLALPDARRYLGALRELADRIAEAPADGPHEGAAAPGRPFGPDFWVRLRIGEDERLDLLRRLVPADGPPGGPGGPRFLDAAAARLAADPRGVQPLLCRWFTDERPLPAEPGSRTRSVRLTVAGAAQALLYAHRGPAVDDLCEALVTTAHPRARQLLAALAEDEPSALCRAVDRWAHDDARPARRAAAATYGRLVAAHATAAADRELLRYAALALLVRPGDPALHEAALDLLAREPRGPGLPGEPEALLRAAALGAERWPEGRVRELVRRAGALSVRTPEGATRFDGHLVQLARQVPGFAALVAGWLARDPEEWVFLVGPSARRTVEGLVTPMPMRAGSHRHGSLRPA